MKSKLMRTSETYLSDDELIIFDVLFDSEIPINALKAGEDFSLRFNYPSHDLNVDELIDTIDKLVSIGLIRLNLSVTPKNKQIITFVGLTEKGGNLWEQERSPIWGKYVIDSCSDERGYWELSVYSTTLEIAKEFIEVSHECHLHELMDKNKIEIQQIEGKDADYLSPWKVFNKLYRIKAQLSEKDGTEHSIETNWGLYKKKMKWWGDVKELQTLKNTLGI